MVVRVAGPMVEKDSVDEKTLPPEFLAKKR